MVQQLRCVFVCRYFCKMHSWRPKLLWCTVPLLPDWFDWTQIRRKNFSVNNLIVSFLFSPSQIRLIDRMFDRLCHRLFHSRFPHRLFHSGFLKMYVIRNLLNVISFFIRLIHSCGTIIFGILWIRDLLKADRQILNRNILLIIQWNILVNKYARSWYVNNIYLLI